MLENPTPMIAQYLSVKAKHPQEILFFRLGDFYEMFFDDAVLASRELEIALTARDGGNKNKIPMCGVPYHAANNYIAKLIDKGYKVAICEQVEDPKMTKGLVKREVIKVVTPGSFFNENLEQGSNSYIVQVVRYELEAALAVVDVFTGEFKYQYLGRLENDSLLLDSLARLNPVELILETITPANDVMLEFLQSRFPKCLLTYYKPDVAEQLLEKHFEQRPAQIVAVKAIENLLAYVQYILKIDCKHINKLEEIVQEEYMRLDTATLRNLELLRNTNDYGSKNSLFWALNATRTSMGARKLRKSIEFPLLNINTIRTRQEAVGVLIKETLRRDTIAELLDNCCDIERLLSKVELNTINPRDLVNLKQTLIKLPSLKVELSNLTASGLLQKLGLELALQSELGVLLEQALVENPPLIIKDGGVFKSGYSQDLDELRELSQDSDTWLKNFEQQQRELTGIKNLKVGYSKIFGYYLEVSKGNVGAVPANFIRKQTLVNGERYIVAELKEFEDKILGSKEKVYQLELLLFENLRLQVAKNIKELQLLAQQLALLDLVLSFATVADRYNYICPQVVSGDQLKIVEGRHPVVERLLKKELFVPNNTDFAGARIQIITGPNMAGKSTYMRQVALLCIMAQVGSFIPASQATISPIEQVFTRVGASDDLATGQSTFMVEMQEVAGILARANKKSLIILDEVGRGTSTYDGISIAHAVVEYIAQKIKAKTLFATHYHELIELETCLTEVKNFSVAIRERGREIVFLRRIVRGGSDKSYGVHVAQLAGLPSSVLLRATALVDFYAKDNNICQPEKTPSVAKKSVDNHSTGDLFNDVFLQEVLELDLPSITPLEALNFLYKFQAELKKT